MIIVQNKNIEIFIVIHTILISPFRTEVSYIANIDFDSAKIGDSILYYQNQVYDHKALHIG